MTVALHGTDVPVEIGGAEAREAAQEELSRAIYHQDDPSLLERAVRWVAEELFDLLFRAGDVAPGGYTGLVVIGLLVTVAAVVIRLRIGPTARAARGDDPLFDDRPVSSSNHRRAADEHAARGAWAEAVRERLRAVIRGLEERDLLETRPGRTADEAADEAGQVLPGCADELREAARTFDEVWYGGLAATPEMDARLRSVDLQVTGARPVRIAGST